MRNQDVFRGCLIGGAAGDALGYPVEFLPEKVLFRQYGQPGITAYRLQQDQALFSDDTQMTLFTAAGLLYGTAQARTGGGPADYARAINAAYLDWLETQTSSARRERGPCHSWLMNVPALYSRRSPGNTCMSALEAGGGGTPEAPITRSKGCGGVMRVAPIGLYFEDRGWTNGQVARLGAEAAALTHGHPLGWMPAAMLAQIIHEIGQDGTPLEEAVLDALNMLDALWPQVPERTALAHLVEQATDLAAGDPDDLTAIHRLGEGWTGDEALAIALYCALKYPGDLDRALIAAVNHRGDSDSTGAIAGNIVGAQIGYAAIPAKYKEKLELHDLVLELADDLWQDGPAREPVSPLWSSKYVDMSYRRSGS